MGYSIKRKREADSLAQRLANFFIKGQTVNILGLSGPTVCVATTQLGHCSSKVAIAAEYVNK